MAKTKYPTPLVAGDMLIEILPRGCDKWTGTRAQIESEGILQGLDSWPEGVADTQWEFGPFTYWLHWQRPLKAKGEVRSGTDYWWLRRRLIVYGRDGFAIAARHDKLCASAEAKWQLTAEADEQCRKAFKARRDQAYVAFMRVATGGQVSAGK